MVFIKGNPKNLNWGLDCDVIVAEVRSTSHKPDEIYGIIERLSPGTRKIELFGRPHNVQPNCITLGNQLDIIRTLFSPITWWSPFLVLFSKSSPFFAFCFENLSPFSDRLESFLLIDLVFGSFFALVERMMDPFFSYSFPLKK